MWMTLGAVAVALLGGLGVGLFVSWRRLVEERKTELGAEQPSAKAIQHDWRWFREPLAAGLATVSAMASAVLAVALVLSSIEEEAPAVAAPAASAEAHHPTTTMPAPAADTGSNLGLSCQAVCAVITGTEITDGGELLVSWESINFQPSLSNFHVHFFFNIYEPEQVGSNSESFGVPQGNWQLTDTSPFDTTGTNLSVTGAPDDATQLCLVVADSGHGVVSPERADCIELS